MTILNTLLFIIGFMLPMLFYYALIGKNPFGSELNIGKKGSGKTTLMTYHIQKYRKKGWNAYCTEKMAGSYYIDYKDIGSVYIPPNSVLLIDEAWQVLHNRNWKNLGTHVIAFMKYCRHYRVKIILYTQSNAEIDVSFMRICDRLNLISNKFNCLGCVRHLKYKQVLIPASSTAEARITDDIVTVPLLLGGYSFYWMPKYWQYFDSFNQPLDLKEVEFEYIDYPLGLDPLNKKKKKKLASILKIKRRQKC